MATLIETARRLAAVPLALAGLGAGTGLAQSPGPVWDPASLPETRGVVKLYTLTPRGDVDGLILTDGTEVNLPPHLTAQVVFAVRPGDAVTVRGVRARAVPLVDGIGLRNEATGAAVVDEGPPNREGRDATLSGRVAMVLHGRRGEVNGVLLEDGTALRMPPHEAARRADLLRAGQSVSARGDRLATALGTVVEVRALGATPDRMTALDRGPPGEPGRPRPPPPGKPEAPPRG
ncbi:hypothetical protein OPKNFCMD_1643 [Methylobacterium crusticola]|uniref:Uncharacterized protein n=1 Tax=Methylobacterium crusticola TaxID=1697972 RepID=A0ABQ4QUR2_9HYPH|nr:hypothetical protein [Methylobacterium crusticola]GJD48917.1 hypothetical protein OPKNFCMD_1643 [Methylobacterium crusticola]